MLKRSNLAITLIAVSVFVVFGFYFYDSQSTETELKLNYDVCFDEHTTKHELKEVHVIILSLNDPGNNLNKLMLRGNCYIKTRDYELALQDVNKVIRLNPEFGLAHQTRAKIHFLLNDYDKAIEDLNHSIAHHLGDVDDHLLLADSYQALGQLGSAEKALKEALVASEARAPLYKPSSSSAVTIAFDEVLLYLALSNVLQQQNKVDESVAVLIEAADRSNGSVDLFDALLALLESQQEYDLIKKYKAERCPIPNIQISDYCRTGDMDGGSVSVEVGDAVN